MFSEIYLKALLDSVRSADALLPNLTRASEAAAARLSAGGEIYISSDRQISCPRGMSDPAE